MTERRHGNRSHAGPHALHVVRHMFTHAAWLLPLAAGALGLGMAIYHFAEGLPWTDAFLNASMLLGGMGPVNALHTTAGKWLAGGYALFAGLVFLVIANLMLSPALHHLLGESSDEDDAAS